MHLPRAEAKASLPHAHLSVYLHLLLLQCKYLTGQLSYKNSLLSPRGTYEQACIACKMAEYGIVGGERGDEEADLEVLTFTQQDASMSRVRPPWYL
jgi:hypothetical protein